jgi:hypothetical protein
MRQNISDPGPEYRKNDAASARSFFSDIGIVVTSRCNLECRHCISDCHPFNTEKLSKKVIEDILCQASRMSNVRSIIFTGGEAFLEYENIVGGIALCEELNLDSSVVTNGFWAVDLNISRQKLRRLKGLKTLNVSVDSFHQEYVPIDRIRNIIQLCYELAIECVVCVSYLNDPLSEIGAVKKQLMGLEDLYIILPQPVSPFGRAASLIDMSQIYSYDPMGIPCYGTDSPIIEANGDVIVCCGGLSSHPGNGLLKIGNIYSNSLQEIKESADLNPIVQMLRLRGPSGLVHLIRNQALKEGFSITPPQMDERMDLCSLCKYVIANPNNAIMLKRAIKDPEVYHEIALARIKEFGEVSML